ncbi:MAG: hypothetical protein ACJATT_004494 [Myxococcota bacterium]|jgi:hypothetical protein
MLLWLALTAHAAPLALDAGPAGTPIFEGFVGLHPTTTTAPGVSWTTPARRGLVYGTPDPLVNDWVQGGVLHIEQPPGDYVAYAYIGAPDGSRWYDPVYPIGVTHGIRVDGESVASFDVPTGLEYLTSTWNVANPFPQFGEGLTEWDRQHRVQQQWIPFEFTMDEDGVDIEVFRTGLQALVIASKAEAIEAEVLIESADAARRIHYLEQTSPQASVWEAPEIGEGPMSVQFTHWREHPNVAEGVTEAVLELNAYRGNRTGQIVWLFGSDDSAQFRIDGLDGIGVETGEVHWLDHRGDIEIKRRPRPTFVRPTQDTLNGEQGAPVGLGLTVIIPEDAKAKTYRGTLHVERGDESMDIPIVVNVSRLEVADNPFPMGYFADLRPVVSQVYGQESQEVMDIFAEDVRLMRERGMDAIGLRLAGTWYPFVGATTQEYQPGALPAAAALWREAGGEEMIWIDPFFAVGNMGGFKKPQTLNLEHIDMMAQAGVENDVALYFYDEGGGRGREPARLARRISAAFRHSQPTVRLAGALDNPVDWPYVRDFDIAMHTLRPHADAGRTDYFRTQGSEGWVYNMMPGRHAPFGGWAMRADGYLSWHWNDSVGDAFSDVSSRQDFVRAFLAPSGDTVWPGTLVNAYGEGVVDVRVLHSLELAAHAAEINGQDVSRARAILEGAAAPILGIDNTGPIDAGRMTEDALALIRQAAATEALRLQRGKKLKSTRTFAAGDIAIETLAFESIVWSPPDYVLPDDLTVLRGRRPTVDGVLDEEQWAQQANGPTLMAGAKANSIADAEMRVVTTFYGLAFGISNLGDDVEGSILIDGGGGGQKWLTINLPKEDGEVFTETCSWFGESMAVERYMPPAFAPCVASGIPVGVRKGDVVEMFVHWQALGDVTADLGLNWLLRGPGKQEGTSVVGGRMRLIAGQQTQNFTTASSRGRTRAVADPIEEVWHVTNTITPRPEDETWVWEVWHMGGLVYHGTVAVPAGEPVIQVDVPLEHRRDAIFTMRSPTGFPFVPVSQGKLPRPAFEFRAGTPVSNGPQEVTYDLSMAYDDVLIQTLAGDRVLGSHTQTLTSGKHSLRITGATGDAVRLTIPSGDSPPTVVTVPFVTLEP